MNVILVISGPIMCLITWKFCRYILFLNIKGQGVQILLVSQTRAPAPLLPPSNANQIGPPSHSSLKVLHCCLGFWRLQLLLFFPLSRQNSAITSCPYPKSNLLNDVTLIHTNAQIKKLFSFKWMSFFYCFGSLSFVLELLEIQAYALSSFLLFFTCSTIFP